MLKNLLLILSTLILQARSHDDAPGYMADEIRITWYMARDLRNMTEHFCKDALYKLRMADLIQKQYQNTYGYELGLIAASIMEKFKHMIRVYRYYSNPKGFKEFNFTMQQTMTGYSIIQSDYNELISETVLFYDTLKDHTDRKAGDNEKAKEFARKHKMRLQTVIEMMERGVDLDALMRRSMSTGSVSAFLQGLMAVDGSTQQQLKKTDNINTWTKKMNGTDKDDEEYKKKLRYIKWAEKWNGFNPETEGVHVPDSVARVGLANDSNFLAKELKGDV